ncbi:uncharacterized protein TNCV_4248371 [Trichonephila clavipes]|nr:uncharacterized protein TNCV_4248371 [Trichonephila clavipes]
MPKKLFVGCVDNEAFHGAFSKSPYEFKHFNLNFIGVYVDGQPVPHNPLELDFSKDQYIRAYQTLFVGTDRMGQDRVLSQEKTTSPYFQGVYSRDTLPPLEENMCAIVNSDDSSQPGTHWIRQFTQGTPNCNTNPKATVFGIPKEPVLESAELITSRLTGAGSLLPPVYGEAWAKGHATGTPDSTFPGTGRRTRQTCGQWLKKNVIVYSFQQDGAPYHDHNDVTSNLNVEVPVWIVRRGVI